MNNQSKLLATLSLFLLSLIVSTTCYAGNGDLLKIAINRGYTSTGCYRLTSRDKSGLDVNKFATYLGKHDYWVVDKGFDKKTAVDWIEFIEMDKKDQGVFSYLSEGKCNYSQLKNKGKFASMKKEPIYRPLAFKGEKPIRYDDILSGNIRDTPWTGEVVDGYIHGKGYGFVKYGDHKYLWQSGNSYMYFEGTYDHGVPASDITVKNYWINGPKIETNVFKAPDVELLAKTMEEDKPKIRELLAMRISSMTKGKAKQYYEEMADILKRGEIPPLSQLIQGRSLTTNDFFYPDENALKMRKEIEGMVTSDDPESYKALYLLTVCDAYHLAATKDSAWAKEVLTIPLVFEPFINSNYWKVLVEAEKYLRVLRNNPYGISQELANVEQIICAWRKRIFALRDQALERRDEAVKSFFNELWDAVVYGPPVKEEVIDPDVSLSSIGITYEVSDWDTELDFITSQIVDESKQPKYKNIKYSDGTKGAIKKYPDSKYFLPVSGEGVFFDDEYVTLEDAIAAEYFLVKYKYTRDKGKK